MRSPARFWPAAAVALGVALAWVGGTAATVGQLASAFAGVVVGSELERFVARWRGATWFMIPLFCGFGLPFVGASAFLDQATGADGALTAFVVAAMWWSSGAALGTAVVRGLDLAAGAALRGLRARLLVAVTTLLLLVVGLATPLAMGVMRFISAAGRGEVSTISIDFGDGPVTGREAYNLLLDPEISRQLGTLFLVGITFLALPAVLSACARVADTVADRLEPVVAAMDAAGAGRRDLRVEEGGIEEIDRLARAFNTMTADLARAERNERAFGRYSSAQLLDRIRATEGDLPAAVRDASVLFADLRGYTTMSEKLPPEAVLEVLNRWFARAVDVVAAHDGWLNKFVGDAMVVAWNGPVDQPDHAERAVRCGLALQAALAEMNAAGTFAEVGGVAMGVGIASGPLVTGTLGGARQAEYAIIGDTVNLASRLTSHAPAGGVYASAATVAAIPTGVPREELEPIVVKGKAEPVRAWAVG